MQKSFQTKENILAQFSKDGADLTLKLYTKTDGTFTRNDELFTKNDEF